jgi:hypothetical protein
MRRPVLGSGRDNEGPGDVTKDATRVRNSGDKKLLDIGKGSEGSFDLCRKIAESSSIDSVVGATDEG